MEAIEYLYPIDKKGIKSLSAKRLVVTMPLIFPRPIKPLLPGEALHVLQNRAMLLENGITTIVTWGGNVFAGMGGTVKALRRIGDNWEIDIIVMSSHHDGAYFGPNEKFVDAVNAGTYRDKYVCCPDGDQDPDTFRLEIGAFMLLPREAVKGQDVFHQPHDG